MSILPREHGAYAQLALPLLTALLSARPSLTAICMTVAALAAFLAHEPAAILLGARGTRSQREQRGRCLRWLGALGATAIAAGVVGLNEAPPVARVAVAVPLVLALLLGALMARRLERTLGGELLAATTLPAVALPVALSSGVATRAAIVATCVWASVFCMATVFARALVRKSESRPRWVLASVGAAPISAAALLVATRVIPIGTLWALAPTSFLCLALTISPPPAKRIRAVGWGLAASSLLTCAALVLAPAR